MKNNLTYDITIEDTKVSDTCMSGLESEEKLIEDVVASDIIDEVGPDPGLVWGKRTIKMEKPIEPTITVTIDLNESQVPTKDWLKNFPMRINLGDGLFGIAKIIKSEDDIPTIEIEVEKTPTLKEIVEKTEGFTLIEREPGLIYRKFDDESYEDSESGRILNSKLICRVRYLLRQIKEKLLLCKTQDEIHELIHNELCKAYGEYPLQKDSSFLHSISENLTPLEPYVTYDIGLNTDPGPIVVMDIKIETDRFQMTGSL